MDHTKIAMEFKKFYRSLKPRTALTVLKRTAAKEMGIAEATIPQKIRDTRNFSKLEIEKMPDVLEKFDRTCKERGINYEPSIN